MNIVFTIPKFPQIPIDCYIAYFAIALIVLFMYWSYYFVHDISFYGWQIILLMISWPIWFIVLVFWGIFVFLTTNHLNDK